MVIRRWRPEGLGKGLGISDSSEGLVIGLGISDSSESLTSGMITNTRLSCLC